MAARLESNQPAPKLLATEGPEGLYPALLRDSATDACLESQHRMGATITRALQVGHKRKTSPLIRGLRLIQSRYHILLIAVRLHEVDGIATLEPVAMVCLSDSRPTTSKRQPEEFPCHRQVSHPQ